MEGYDFDEKWVWMLAGDLGLFPFFRDSKFPGKRKLN